MVDQDNEPTRYTTWKVAKPLKEEGEVVVMVVVMAMAEDEGAAKTRMHEATLRRPCCGATSKANGRT